MILHDYWRSSAAFRVRIALALKGIEPGRRYVHLRKASSARPATWPGSAGAGAHASRTARSPSPVPRDHRVPGGNAPEATAAAGRARRARLGARRGLAVACEIHPLNNLRVLEYLGRELHADEAARGRWYAHWVAEGLAAIEKMLAARPGPGPFCLGAAPTMADVCLVPQVFNARRYRVPVEPYPSSSPWWTSA